MRRSRPQTYLLLPLIATLGLIVVAVVRAWGEDAEPYTQAQEARSVPWCVVGAPS